MKKLKVIRGTMQDGKVTSAEDVTEQFLDRVAANADVVPSQKEKTFAPANCPCPDEYNGPVPAVIFQDGVSYYTIDGSITYPANIYNMMAGSNVHVAESALGYVNEDNYPFVKNTIDNAMLSNVAIVCDGFLSTMYNIYDVFVQRLNTILPCHSATKISLEDADNFNDAINAFLCSSDDLRSIILGRPIVDYCISFVNIIGTSIYNAARAQVAQDLNRYAAAQYDGWNGKSNVNTAELFERILPSVDSAFGIMMGDMTYECGVFANSLANMSQYLFTGTNSEE